MCGIAGYAGARDIDPVPAMLGMMSHRGPDMRGFFRSGEIRLGHCRLSINDLSENARQPFVSPGGDVAVAVNGEIYNYRELRPPLEKKGRRFRSDSDCEVILHGYLERGLDFIALLNGMFAIAVWDGRSAELHLVRDRLGIKPLYYAPLGDEFLFASEIKALAAHDRLDLETDPQSLAEYLSFENYFGNRTLNRHIRMVLPGEIVTRRPGDRSPGRRFFYRAENRPDDSLSPGETRRRYLETVEASVARHLAADVPVGSYLSAGIDSPTVAWWACRQYGPGLRTYTGSFGLPGFYDEATAAEQIARDWGCRHRVVPIGPEDFRREMGRIAWHLDEPRVGMGSFSQYMVAAAASREVKVILTGHGGDEFFAGYPVFKAILGKKDPLGFLARSSLREKMFYGYFALYPKIRKEAGYFLPNIFSVRETARLLESDYPGAPGRGADPLRELEALRGEAGGEYERLFLTYLRLYLPALFVVEDKISMAFSLESRTPLCDNEMLDLALSIPLERKIENFELKSIPRAAMAGKLPGMLYRLPKRGFPTPLRAWFRKELREYAREFILDNLSLLPMFRAREVRRIVLDFQRGGPSLPWDEISAHKIWMLINLVHYFDHQKARYGRVPGSETPGRGVVPAGVRAGSPENDTSRIIQ